MPFISVLIPVYNVSEYLRACLDSLLSQDFKDFEALLLDDGSTDGSQDIVDEYARKDARFKAFHKENSGYGATLNYGIERARGDYLAILESDDCMCEGALTHMSELARTYHPDTLHCGFKMWWSNTGVTQHVNQFPVQMHNRVINPSRDLRFFLTMPSLWSGLYARVELIEAHHIRFSSTPGASFQDTSFSFEVFARAQSCVVDDVPIIMYRQDREASSIHSLTKKDLLLAEFDRIDVLAQKLAPQNSFLQTASLTACVNGCLWYLDRLDDKHALEFVGALKTYFSARAKKDPAFDEHLDRWRALNVKKLICNPQKYLNLRKNRHDSTLSKLAFAFRLAGLYGIFVALEERRARS